MEVLIVGSGGLAKEVAFLLEEINRSKGDEEEFTILGYVDIKEKMGTRNGKHAVVMCDDDLVKTNKRLGVVLGIGNPNMVELLVEKYLKNNNLVFPNVIHPNAVGDWSQVKMGVGNVICAGNIFTTNITLGDFNYFNLSCTIGHDAVIRDFNIINPSTNISGGVEIGISNLIGTGAQILQYIKIGNHNILGAGSVVSKEVSDSGVYVGIPARRIKDISN